MAKGFSLVFSVGAPEYVGTIPARKDVEVLPADPTVDCPACGETVHAFDFQAHCDDAGDEAHLAASVMSS